ncbi:translation initiation factor eIF-2B subunit gamma-like isoform X2 [Lytechinus variegatus]|uniref:translation initiation factor eIF-2B subunit gamma-like isoform X2 n=1 Tax=Lytechinus variegatus TaxID=7654 RepID=UPI001BB1BA78|nr:translation initiation factor eIF-2B subunit gamma-like isoform X2 [Lytechinus variegatus]
MEFQAVIMAAGRGSRMTDLSNNIPKALLPIGNHPMIWYPINMLEKAGFERVIIITLESFGKDLRQKLKSCGETKLELDIVTIPNDEDWGTAESLRHIRDKIKTDVLVISSDLITDIELHLLADIHRKYDSTITTLLYQQPDQGLEGITVPGTRSKKKSDQRDIIGLDEKGQRMLLMTAEADVEVSLGLKMSLLRKFPCIQFETRLLDAHMYFLKKWVVDFLADSKQGRNLTTLKGEVLPYLVKKQFSKLSHISKAEDKESAIIDVKQDGQLDLSQYLPYDELSKKVLEMSPWNEHKGEMSRVYQKGDSLRCYTYIASSGTCLRANNVAAYCEANRQVTSQKHLLGDEPLVHPSVSKSKSSGIGKDCMVGERSSIGDQVSVKRSIIGRHCTIGDKVKINNSVIMDHVTIKEGCVIQGSILCPNAHILQNVDLKDSIVGTSQNVVEGASYNGEVIGEGDMMMEI